MLRLIVGTRFQVLFHSAPAVLFTFPSRYSSLSVAREYLALGGGPPRFPRGFSCPAVLGCLFRVDSVSRTGLSPSMAGLPMPFCYRFDFLLCERFTALSYRSRYPIYATAVPLHVVGLGSSAFARHYSRNHSCFLFLGVLRCFSSPGYLYLPMYSASSTDP
jgi:hypothetical protein